jgi:hypothetical protein
MTTPSDQALERLAPALVWDGDWCDVLERAGEPRQTTRRRQTAFRLRRTRRTVITSVALAALVGSAAALAAGALLGAAPFKGPPAPSVNDTALRALFPPERIGRATQLAENEGRTLFGARTARGGYCFSATSPTDPNGEGGHCVSEDEARTLTAGGSVAFAMSGWSVGGYAPGATGVRIAGVGLDETIAVNHDGWWIGVAQLPVGQMMRQHHLPDGTDRGTLVATSLAADGQEIGHDPVMVVKVATTGDGQFAGISFSSA